VPAQYCKLKVVSKHIKIINHMPDAEVKIHHKFFLNVGPKYYYIWPVFTISKIKLRKLKNKI